MKRRKILKIISGLGAFCVSGLAAAKEGVKSFDYYFPDHKPYKKRKLKSFEELEWVFKEKTGLRLMPPRRRGEKITAPMKCKYMTEVGVNIDPESGIGYPFIESHLPIKKEELS